MLVLELITVELDSKILELKSQKYRKYPFTEFFIFYLSANLLMKSLLTRLTNHY